MSYSGLQSWCPPWRVGADPEPGEEQGFPHTCPRSLEYQCMNFLELKGFINRLPSWFAHS